MRTLKRGLVTFGTELADTIKAAVSDYAKDPDAQRMGVAVISFGNKRKDIELAYGPEMNDGLLHFRIRPVSLTDEQLIDRLREFSNKRMHCDIRKLLGQAAQRLEDNFVANRDTVEQLEDQLSAERSDTHAAQADAKTQKTLVQIRELEVARHAEDAAKALQAYYSLKLVVAAETTQRLKNRNYSIAYGMGDTKSRELFGGTTTGRTRS